ncbi:MULTISPECIES: TrkH family potassium uptake protein [Halomonadaceae]|jgi:trk system potassium uptake protein|uniref:Trk system potassium uptake protein n=1 Tax=Halomonas campaniensis TaxID=213554 RepID=A0A246S072_9GAMM|nr:MULTISPECIES: TrkH family potassium uptake protein [Halomonas]MBS3669290.1 TrkH family potassium uptake protein [Halomonas boliviensis]OWV29819.1 potassium transporter TrkH [Halomonas campaniensis]
MTIFPSGLYYRDAYRNWAQIFKIMAVLWLVLAMFMAIPWIVLLVENDPDAPAFGVSILIVLSATLATWLLTRKVSLELKPWQMFVLTAASWASITGFASLPLILGAPQLSVTNAVFESVSAITTTGSTVMVGIEHFSDGLKLWRGLMQWMGGIGIIVMGIAILPFLKVGGMRLFHTESSDWSDKVMPRTGGIAKATLSIYVALTLAAMVSYWAGGMLPLDAVVHGMTSLATGGFANSDASFGAYAEQPWLLWMGSFFMLSGALPFVLYIRFIRTSRTALWKDQQVRGLLKLLLVAIVVLSGWRVLQGDDWFVSLTHVTFNVISVVTTTGYASDDYTLWGALPVTAFFYLTFVGGCSGSTSGGMKIFRFQIAMLMLLNQLRYLIHANGVFTTRYNQQPVTSDISRSVVAFSFFFFITIAALALSLSALGLDLVTAISGAATAVANVGPGLGDTIGPAGNFSSLPEAAKWLLCIGMLMGRLEILTVVVLMTPMFWRR